MEVLVRAEIGGRSMEKSGVFGGRFANRRVLVTGHTGFKGSWLTAWLLQMGAEVCGYSIDIPSRPSLFEAAGLAGRIEHHFGDIRDGAHFGEVFHSFRPDFMFHMAAQAIVSLSYADPVETISTNVLGTASVLNALRSVDWPCVSIIVASDKCYENVEWPWGYRENDRLGGKDVYSASKGAAEIVFQSFYRSFFADPAASVRLGTVRAGNVLGGGDWATDRIVADCIRAWEQKSVVKLRRPTSVRPWQHVLEPLSGYLSFAAGLESRRSLSGESFNFGPPAEQNRTVLELLTELAGVWGFDNPAASYAVLPSPPFAEAGLLKLSCEKALSFLEWEANLSFSETARMTGDWYRAVLKDRRPALDVTLAQIKQFEELAHGRGRAWATA